MDIVKRDDVIRRDVAEPLADGRKRLIVGQNFRRLFERGVLIDRDQYSRRNADAKQAR